MSRTWPVLNAGKEDLERVEDRIAEVCAYRRREAIEAPEGIPPIDVAELLG